MTNPTPAEIDGFEDALLSVLGGSPASWQQLTKDVCAAARRSITAWQGWIFVCPDCGWSPQGHIIDNTGDCLPECWCKPENYPPTPPCCDTPGSEPDEPDECVHGVALGGRCKWCEAYGIVLAIKRRLALEPYQNSVLTVYEIRELLSPADTPTTIGGEQDWLEQEKARKDKVGYFNKGDIDWEGWRKQEAEREATPQGAPGEEYRLSQQQVDYIVDTLRCAVNDKHGPGDHQWWNVGRKLLQEAGIDLEEGGTFVGLKPSQDIAGLVERLRTRHENWENPYAWPEAIECYERERNEAAAALSQADALYRNVLTKKRALFRALTEREGQLSQAMWEINRWKQQNTHDAAMANANIDKWQQTNNALRTDLIEAQAEIEDLKQRLYMEMTLDGRKPDTAKLLVGAQARLAALEEELRQSRGEPRPSDQIAEDGLHIMEVEKKC